MTESSHRGPASEHALGGGDANSKSIELTICAHGICEKAR